MSSAVQSLALGKGEGGPPWADGQRTVWSTRTTASPAIDAQAAMLPEAANLLRAGARHKGHTLYDSIYSEIQIRKCRDRKWIRGWHGLGGDG